MVMAPNSIKEFFRINIWQIVLVLGWLMTGVWVIAKLQFTVDSLERSWNNSLTALQGNLENTIGNLDRRLIIVENDYKNISSILNAINSDGSSATRNHVDYDNQRHILLETRLQRLEDGITKLNVIENNTLWLKDSLGRVATQIDTINERGKAATQGTISSKP